MPAWLPYDSQKLRQYNGNAINFASGGDTLKVMLVTSSYTPNRATHVFKSDLGATEVTGSNYTAGGVVLANQALSVVANILHWDTDDAVWLQHATGFTTARYAELFKWTGVDATSPLVAYLDLGGNVGNVAGPLSITIADVFTV
jgi:hypothetical protein